MKRHSLVNYCLAATLLIPAALVGCGGGAESTAQTAVNSSSDAGTPSTAQAAKATVIDGKGTDCAQTVAIFLDSLRRGDERAANAVLTAKAQEELAKCAYALQPLGTPEGKFQIGRVGFPYPEKNVALVECLWSEPVAAGEAPLSMEIVCEVHQESDGWRISGMGITLAGTEDAVVLDFEDAKSLAETLASATDDEGTTPAVETPSTQSTSQVAQPGSNLPALPAIPGIPGDSPNLQQQPAQQIALPPLNDAPIIR